MRIVNVAKVVVQNPAGDVLLLRRSETDDRRPGELDFPGGSVDPGETFEGAATRETFEEAGLVIASLSVLYAATELRREQGESINRMLFLAQVTETEATMLRFSDEHSEGDWVAREVAAEKLDHHFYGFGLRYGIDNGLL